MSARSAIIFVVTAALPLTAALVADKGLFHGSIKIFLGDKPYELALQFLMITVLGGALFAFLTVRKEEDARRDTRVGRLQVLDDKLAGAHRHMKSSKRRLRSKLDRTKDPQFTIAKGDFEDCMDEVLAAQLAVEEVQDLIQTRRDLIDHSDFDLVDRALQYVARYLHDVFEDFEKGKIVRDHDTFVLTAETSRNLWDFLFKPKEPEAVAKQLAILEDRTRQNQASLDALAALEKHKESAGQLSERFGRVAHACILLASWELKRLMDNEAS